MASRIVDWAVGRLPMSALHSLRSSIVKIITFPGGSGLGGSSALRPFVNGNPWRALQANVSWVWKCVERVSLDIADIFEGLQLFIKRSATVEDLVDRHPGMDLLENPSDELTSHDMFQMIDASLNVHGAAVVFKNRGALPDGTPMAGPPLELQFLPWQYLRARIDKETSRVVGFRWRPPGSLGDELFIPREDVMFFTQPSLRNIKLGEGTLLAAAAAADENFHIKQARIGFFRSGSLRGPIIQAPEGATDEQNRALYQDYMTFQSGVGRFYYPMILPDKYKIEGAPQKQKDVDFLAGGDAVRDEIFVMFGTPKTVMGLSEKDNRATAETNERGYQKRTLSPRVKRICRVLDRDYFPEWDANGQGRWKCKVVDFIVQDRDQLRADMQAEIPLGVSTPAEWRDKLGHEESENEATKLHFMQLGLRPLSDEPEPDPEPEPDTTPPQDPPPEEDDDDDDDEEQRGVQLGKAACGDCPEKGADTKSNGDALCEDCPQEKYANRPSLTKPKKPKKGLEVLLPDDADWNQIDRGEFIPFASIAWMAFARRHKAHERALAAAYRKTLDQQHKAVVAAVRKEYTPIQSQYAGWSEAKIRAHARERNLAGDILWDPTTETGRMLEAALPSHEKAYHEQLDRVVLTTENGRPVAGEKGIITLEVEIPVITDERITEWLNDNWFVNIRAFNSTTAKVIRELVLSLVATGATVDEIIAGVDEKYKGVKTWRADAMVRTQMTGTLNNAFMEGAAPVEDRFVKAWLTAGDERVRNDGPYSHLQAEADHAEGIEVKEHFIIAPAGEPLLHPGDPNGSIGNTIRCRCSQVLRRRKS